MKQEILVKLFNETPLTTDEILYVSNNLKEGEALASEAREYDHSSTNVFEACGLNDTEVEAGVKQIHPCSAKKERAITSSTVIGHLNSM